MHPSHHHHLRAHPATRRTAKIKVLELVVLAVVFVLGVSFGMYFEKKASTGSSSTSSKQVLLQQQTQQQGGPGCDALIHQAEVDRDETWQETVGQLQAEIKKLSSDIGKMVHPRRIPADCMARLGPQVDGQLFASPSAEAEGEKEVARAMAQAAEKEEAGEEGDAEKETTAAAAAAAAHLIKDLQAEVD